MRNKQGLGELEEGRGEGENGREEVQKNRAGVWFHRKVTVRKSQ